MWLKTFVAHVGAFLSATPWKREQGKFLAPQHSEISLPKPECFRRQWALTPSLAEAR